MADSLHESKTALLDAATSVIRTKGYNATRVEDICQAAQLTKGSFFHHFKSKEEVAVAAADRWASGSGELFASAAYHELPDPVDRLLGYIDYRKALLEGTLPEITCLAGTMIQEVYATHPAIRDACEKSISEHMDALKLDTQRRPEGLHQERLRKARHALEQHVAARKQADEQALEHRVLADDDALDLVQRLVQGPPRVLADGRRILARERCGVVLFHMC